MSRMTSTTSSATPSRMPSMPANAAAKSAMSPPGPPDVAVEPGRHQGARDLVAHRLGALDERRGVATGLGALLGVERHGDEHGLAVLGRDRDDRASRPRGSRRGSSPPPISGSARPGRLCAKRRDGLEVLGGQRAAVGALDDDEVGQRVAVDEGRDRVADQRRLGALGQEGRVVVGLDARELALGGAAEGTDDQPHEATSDGAPDGDAGASWNWHGPRRVPGSCARA